MVLPNVERASIDRRKLAGYVLNASHPEGRHKARVFASALGIAAADTDWFAGAILTGVSRTEAVLQRVTTWESIYAVDVDIVCGPKCAKVRTVWLCTEAATRFVTCFVIGECDEGS